MSPDIEWRVGDEEDNETIAKTPPPYSSSRWWKVLFVFMVVAVIGLGIVYSDRLESTPHSTPTPLPPTATPQAIPAKLGETIDREVRALADGDFKTFLSRMRLVRCRSTCSPLARGRRMASGLQRSMLLDLWSSQPRI